MQDLEIVDYYKSTILTSFLKYVKQTVPETLQATPFQAPPTLLDYQAEGMEIPVESLRFSVNTFDQLIDTYNSLVYIFLCDEIKQIKEERILEQGHQAFISESLILTEHEQKHFNNPQSTLQEGITFILTCMINKGAFYRVTEGALQVSIAGRTFGYYRNGSVFYHFPTPKKPKLPQVENLQYLTNPYTVDLPRKAGHYSTSHLLWTLFSSLGLPSEETNLLKRYLSTLHFTLGITEYEYSQWQEVDMGLLTRKLVRRIPSKKAKDRVIALEEKRSKSKQEVKKDTREALETVRQLTLDFKRYRLPSNPVPESYRRIVKGLVLSREEYETLVPDPHLLTVPENSTLSTEETLNFSKFLHTLTEKVDATSPN